MERQRNWADNYAYTARQIHRPATIGDLQELVARSDKVKALGTRHCFNDIADSPGDLISLEKLDRIISLDRDRHTVTIEGGIKYGTLCHHLATEEFALQNMASLPHISVAGACATATHGSGVKNQNLSAAVAAMEIVSASGDAILLSRDKDAEQFNGAVVHLGALGIVAKLTLDIVPAFELRQDVYENLPFATLEKYFDELASAAYSVSFFTDWSGPLINQVWLKSRATNSDPPPTLHGATYATENVHPLKGMSPENCTEQMGVCGPSHERLPHFRMEYTPSSGEELQSEYFVAREHAFKALFAISRMGEQIAPLLQISEIRTIAADNLWMSPCYEEDSVAIHFTWKKDWPAVSKLLPILEAALAPFAARPHWGKLFHMHPAKWHPRANDFRELMLSHDSGGKFRNEFTERYFSKH